MTILYFNALHKNSQDAVIELTTKSNWRMFVLDLWYDDSMPCILVKAHTWSFGIIRFIITHLNEDEAAAFRFIDCDRARKIIGTVLLREQNAK